MDKEKILLPTFFPETVTANIKTNEKNTYTVSYINNLGETLDEVSGTRSKKEASSFLPSMIEKWQKDYPKLSQSLAENQDLLTFCEFPPSIRRTC